MLIPPDVPISSLTFTHTFFIFSSRTTRKLKLNASVMVSKCSCART